MITITARRPTVPAGTCVWILLVCIVFTMIMTNCNAQGIDEKRMSEELQQFGDRQAYPRQMLWSLYQNADRVRRGHRYMTDAGYGSRIQAASKVASALTAHHDLFGSYGPGRRKRPSPSTSQSDVIRRILGLGAGDARET